MLRLKSDRSIQNRRIRLKQLIFRDVLPFYNLTSTRDFLDDLAFLPNSLTLSNQ
ncbi:MAG TPA: hypothetical protein VK184_13280 [Nostocaceae cyanobacterium]|nr:hypothetical protein [Nostocaceae cyanobacterium]